MPRWRPRQRNQGIHCWAHFFRKLEVTFLRKNGCNKDYTSAFSIVTWQHELYLKHWKYFLISIWKCILRYIFWFSFLNVSGWIFVKKNGCNINDSLTFSIVTNKCTPVRQRAELKGQWLWEVKTFNVFFEDVSFCSFLKASTSGWTFNKNGCYKHKIWLI